MFAHTEHKDKRLNALALPHEFRRSYRYVLNPNTVIPHDVSGSRRDRKMARSLPARLQDGQDELDNSNTRRRKHGSSFEFESILNKHAALTREIHIPRKVHRQNKVIPSSHGAFIPRSLHEQGDTSLFALEKKHRLLLDTDNTQRTKTSERYKPNSPFNVKSKSLGSRWKIDEEIPNINIISAAGSIRQRSRDVLSREDTFDADYMMPRRVREVLESEGVTNRTINNTIGLSEEKHRKAISKMADALRYKDTKTDGARGGHLSGHAMTSNCTPFGTHSYMEYTSQDPLTGNMGLWKNPFREKDTTEDELDDDTTTELEHDKRNWTTAQNKEQQLFGTQFHPPRLVDVLNHLTYLSLEPHRRCLCDQYRRRRGITRRLIWVHTGRTKSSISDNDSVKELVSSKVTKFQLLNNVYNDGVVHVTYDFDTWSFSDILDAVKTKLEDFKRNLKVKSIMVLCQGGPGYIYLLRNFAVTPQKLYKPSYRGVVWFWKCLAGLVSKIHPQDAAIHIFGFNMMDNDQGRKLLPMLQSLVHPNIVRVEVASDDTEEGKAVAELYFKQHRFKIWRQHQNTSVNAIDFAMEEKFLEKDNDIVHVNSKQLDTAVMKTAHDETEIG